MKDSMKELCGLITGSCYTPSCQDSVAGLLFVLRRNPSLLSLSSGTVLADVQERFTTEDLCFMGKGNIGKHPWNWKGGRTVTQAGYVLIFVGKDHPIADVRGYAYEHRLKAWQAGHDITGKHVHHEDEIKSNNDDRQPKAADPGGTSSRASASG